MTIAKSYEQVQEESPAALLCADRLPYNYSVLLESFGFEVLSGHSTDGREGSWYLLQDPETLSWGYLAFGRGSSPNTDALQACATPEEVDALRRRLWDSIHWEPDEAAFRHWWVTHDWTLPQCWREHDFMNFWMRVCVLFNLDGPSEWGRLVRGDPNA